MKLFSNELKPNSHCVIRVGVCVCVFSLHKSIKILKRPMALGKLSLTRTKMSINVTTRAVNKKEKTNKHTHKHRA